MPPVNNQSQDYDFIVNPSQPSKPSNPMGNTSTLMKIVFGGGALVIILIFISIARSLLSGDSDVDKYIVIAQDQQQLTSILSGASKQKGLSTVSTNSILTAQTSLATDKSDILEYMQKNNVKVKPQVLSAKVSATLNEQLNASAAAGTYDQTYKMVMDQQLEAYQRDLQSVYKQTKGKNGHVLLDRSYDNATLLRQQLQTP